MLSQLKVLVDNENVNFINSSQSQRYIMFGCILRLYFTTVSLAEHLRFPSIHPFVKENKQGYFGLKRAYKKIKRIYFHSVKSVHIQSFSDPHFPAFWLNEEIYKVNLRTQLECGKIRTRKTPNTVTFHAVLSMKLISITESFTLSIF